MQITIGGEENHADNFHCSLTDHAFQTKTQIAAVNLSFFFLLSAAAPAAASAAAAAAAAASAADGANGRLESRRDVHKFADGYVTWLSRDLAAPRDLPGPDQWGTVASRLGHYASVLSNLLPSLGAYSRFQPISEIYEGDVT